MLKYWTHFRHNQILKRVANYAKLTPPPKETILLYLIEAFFCLSAVGNIHSIKYRHHTSEVKICIFNHYTQLKIPSDPSSWYLFVCYQKLFQFSLLICCSMKIYCHQIIRLQIIRCKSSYLLWYSINLRAVYM